MRLRIDRPKRAGLGRINIISEGVCVAVRDHYLCCRGAPLKERVVVAGPINHLHCRLWHRRRSSVRAQNATTTHRYIDALDGAWVPLTAGASPDNSPQRRCVGIRQSTDGVADTSARNSEWPLLSRQPTPSVRANL